MRRPITIAAICGLSLVGCVDPVVIGQASVGIGDGESGDVGDDGFDDGSADGGDLGSGVGAGCDCGPVHGVVLLDDLGSLWRFGPEDGTLELLGDVGCDERFGVPGDATGVAVASNGEAFVLYEGDALFVVDVGAPAECFPIAGGDEVSGPHEVPPSQPLPIPPLAPRRDIAHIDRAMAGGCGVLASVRPLAPDVFGIERMLPDGSGQGLIGTYQALDARVTAASGGRLFVWLLRENSAGLELSLLELSPTTGAVLDEVSVPGLAGLWGQRNVLAAVPAQGSGDDVLVFIDEGNGSTTVVRAHFPERDGEQPTVTLVVDELPIEIVSAAPTPC